MPGDPFRRCAPLGREFFERIVPDRVKAVVAGRLLEVPAFVKRVVIDQWFLHRREPALTFGAA